ncbi:hypothetical protein [Nitrospirillum amazonense]|uniref:hypothetical protein n=1 Tax=Nitrospirillum amazonense TaxID=28077 RepID=UPI0011A8C75E|nr:hypothetical protein [Nitrospirillum amazonense]
MVNRIFFLGISIIFATPCAALAKPRSIKISSITVEKTGLYEPGRTPQPEIESACRNFSATDKTVSAWLNHSKEVSEIKYFSENIITNCTATGTLIAQNGLRYNWVIDLGGSAVIYNEEKKTKIYLIGKELY